MSLATAAQVSAAKTTSYKNLSVDLESGVFTVGSRELILDKADARLISFLIEQGKGDPVSNRVIISSLGYESEDAFSEAWSQLQNKLVFFNIANDGGTDDLLYEESILGADLFRVVDDGIKFNAQLADLIIDTPLIKAEDLANVKHIAQHYGWFRPRLECCL
ncbi:MAG: hypothetical protein AAGB32_03445 [Pseudomonadota bacterium]